MRDLLYVQIQFDNMKNHQQSATSQVCGSHDEPFSFICFQKNCPNGYKLCCAKCKKEHAQHPNRLCSLAQFSKHINKPMKYIDNAIGFSLMNLKKKVEYIRDFRTSILDKQIQLMDSNKNLKECLNKILLEHYNIKDVISSLNNEVLQKDLQSYEQSLRKSKDFIIYNPTKCQFQITNSIIQISKINLEKYLLNSNTLIDNIREYLIKIIEVLLASTCIHEGDGDEEDIEFDEEQDGDATSFNITIKNRINAMDHPEIKNRIQHIDILETFDEEKEVFGKQIQMLKSEIKNKSEILKRIQNGGGEENLIQTTNHQVRRYPHQFDQNQEKYEQLINQNQKLKLQLQILREKEFEFASQEQKMQSQYNQTLSEKQQQIKEYRKTVQMLQKQVQKLKLEPINGQSNELVDKINQQLQDEAIKVRNLEEKLLQHHKLEQQLKSTIQTLDNEISALKNANSEHLERQIKSNSTLNEQQSIIFQLEQKLASVNSQFDDAKENLIKEKYLAEKSKIQVEAKLKHTVTYLDKQIEKVNQEISKKDMQIITLKSEYQSKIAENEKSFKAKEALASVNFEKEKASLQGKIKSYEQKLQEFKMLIETLEQQIQNSEALFKLREKSLLGKIKQLQQISLKSAIHDTCQGSPTSNKKYQQAKQMLTMCIKKNQELKDKNYSLQLEVNFLKSDQNTKDSKRKMEKTEDPSFLRSLKGQSSEISISKSNIHDFIFNEEEVDSMTSDRKSLKANEGKARQIRQSFNTGRVKTSMNGQSYTVLKQQSMLNSKNKKKKAYEEIKTIFKTVSQDMSILEERLKENNVIEKVYLKQLERKRNENRNLKKQIDSLKLYSGSKQPYFEEPFEKKKNFNLAKHDKTQLSIQVSSSASGFASIAANQHKKLGKPTPFK